jgi:hypothetical protein
MRSSRLVGPAGEAWPSAVREAPRTAQRSPCLRQDRKGIFFFLELWIAKGLLAVRSQDQTSRKPAQKIAVTLARDTAAIRRTEGFSGFRVRGPEGEKASPRPARRRSGAVPGAVPRRQGAPPVPARRLTPYGKRRTLALRDLRRACAVPRRAPERTQGPGSTSRSLHPISVRRGRSTSALT